MPSVKSNNNPSKILFTENKKLPKLANVGFQKNKGNRPAFDELQPMGLSQCELRQWKRMPPERSHPSE
jgi:hypothetical protein